MNEPALPPTAREPAFPTAYVRGATDKDDQTRLSHFDIGQSGGMSLRDYFAAAALTGSLASNVAITMIGSEGVVARSCYALADAMLAERKWAVPIEVGPAE